MYFSFAGLFYYIYQYGNRCYNRIKILGVKSMGLFFNRHKKQDEASPAPQTHNAKAPNNTSTVSDSNGSFPTKSYAGTAFEKNVITFDERKKRSLPSGRGLYVAEVLLLYYCSLGTYPNPKNGYPGFWWYEYGIQDVDYMLSTLEKRGFICFGSPKQSLNGLSATELKQILKEHNLPVSGKKAELIEKISQSVSDDELLAAGIEPKYALTDLGKMELKENAYIPYMHKHPKKTTEDSTFGPVFNVWSINQLLGAGNTSDWEKVVAEQENLIDKEREKRRKEQEKEHEALMSDLKKKDPETYRELHQLDQELKAQDDQLELIQTAAAKYAEDKDLNAYIAFWEDLWEHGGLTFEGVKWHFTLADLYIKAKRYDDALNFVKQLKRKKKNYSENADKYIARIEGLIEKQNSKNKK